MYFKSEPIDIESIQMGVCQRIIEFALSVGFYQTYRRRYREVWTRGLTWLTDDEEFCPAIFLGCRQGCKVERGVMTDQV